MLITCSDGPLQFTLAACCVHFHTCHDVLVLQERIASCEAQLAQLDDQVVTLKGEFETKKGLELELKSCLNKAEATLNAASSLLDKLGGERNRWQNQVLPCAFLNAIARLSPGTANMLEA